MSNRNQTFKTAVKSYLDGRAQQDEQFAAAYAKPGKSLDECCQYIMGEARKRGTAVAMTDDEVFGLAVHYYDEDDIEVRPAGNCRTVQVPELTEAEKEEARRRAIDRLAEEQYALLRKKPHKKREEAEAEVQQMSLF